MNSSDDLKAIDRLCDQFESAAKLDLEELGSYLPRIGANNRNRLFNELLRIVLDCDQAITEAEVRQTFPEYGGQIAAAFFETRGQQLSARGRLGDYEIVEEIDRGGMGVVYKAWQMKLGRHVALKSILTGSLASGEELNRFLTEATAAANLNHPNIVQVYDIGEDSSGPFFSMELVDGPDLAKRIEGEPQPFRWSCELIREIAKAVQHAHDAGIFHRDLKPSNVLLADCDTPKVTDFGLAKIRDQQGSKTRTGDLLGTASYMAPEQAGGSADITAATDIYGLGAIFYELITGRPPFRGETSWETINQLINHDPTQITLLRPGTPRDIETIITKCLRKEPNQRYGSAADLADDIDRFLTGKAIKARPVSKSERLRKLIARNRAMAMTIAVSLVMIVASVSVGFWRVVEERDRFRAQRDRAEAHLYDALIGDTRAQLSAREGSFWFQARDNLEQAALLTSVDRDKSALRNLAIEWMGSEFPCLTRTVLYTHTERVNDVSMTQDGSIVASSSTAGSIVLVDGSDGSLVKQLRVASGVNQVKISPDGMQMLIATTDSRLIRLRGPFGTGNGNDSDSREVITLPGYAVTEIRFRPSNGELLLGCSDGKVRVGSAAFSNAMEFEALPDQVGEITDLALSGDADRLAAVGADRRMAVWDLVERKVLRSIDLSRTPTCVTFCAKDQNLVWSDNERFGLFFESVENKVLSRSAIRNLHSQSILHLHEMPGGEILTGSADGTIALLDPIRIRNVGRAFERAGRLLALRVSEDGTKIASGYENGKVVMWEVNYSPFFAQHIYYYWAFFNSEQLAVSRQQVAAILDPIGEPVEFTPTVTRRFGDADSWEFRPLPGGKRFVRARHDGRVDFLTAGLELDFSIDVCPDAAAGSRDVVWSLDVSHDGRWVVAGSANDRDGYVNVIDVEAEQLVFRENRHSKLVSSVKFHPGGRCVFSCSTDGGVIGWRIEADGQLSHAHELAHIGHAALSLSINGRGDQLAVATNQDKIYCWSIDELARQLADTNARVSARPEPRIIDGMHGNSVRFVSYALDDKYLISGSEHGSLIFSDAETLEEVVRFRSGTGQIRNVVFSADRKWMVVNSYLRPTFIWDFANVRRQLDDWNLDW